MHLTIGKVSATLYSQKPVTNVMVDTKHSANTPCDGSADLRYTGYRTIEEGSILHHSKIGYFTEAAANVRFGRGRAATG